MFWRLVNVDGVSSAINLCWSLCEWFQPSAVDDEGLADQLEAHDLTSIAIDRRRDRCPSCVSCCRNLWCYACMLLSLIINIFMLITWRAKLSLADLQDYPGPVLPKELYQSVLLIFML